MDDMFTDEEIAALEAAGRAAFVKQQLSKESMLLFRLIIVMWNIGKANGVWSDSDVDDDLRTKIANWKTKLDNLVAEDSQQ